MYENNEPVEVSFESLDSAIARVKELQSRLTAETVRADDYKRMYDNLQDQVDRAKRAFEDVLEGHVSPEEELEAYSEMIEALDWYFSREVQVTITAYWSGTITLPYSKDLDDLSIGFETPECHDEGVEMDLGWHVDDYEVSRN